MLIPKEILALGKIAAKNSSRYAMTSIRIERHNGTPRALATDGHRAFIFTWDEPDVADFPPIDGMRRESVSDYAANIPFDALASAAKGISKRCFKPALSHMLLDESDRNAVRLAATTLERVTRAEASADEANFPPLDDVVPQPQQDKTLFDPAVHHDVPFTHVRIAVNAKLMAEMLIAMVGAAGEQADYPVTLTVPILFNRPIRLDAQTYERKAVGVVMPVNLPQDVQRPAEDTVEGADETTPSEATPEPEPEAAVA